MKNIFFITATVLLLTSRALAHIVFQEQPGLTGALISYFKPTQYFLGHYICFVFLLFLIVCRASQLLYRIADADCQSVLMIQVRRSTYIVLWLGLTFFSIILVLVSLRIYLLDVRYEDDYQFTVDPLSYVFCFFYLLFLQLLFVQSESFRLLRQQNSTPNHAQALTRLHKWIRALVALGLMTFALWLMHWFYGGDNDPWYSESRVSTSNIRSGMCAFAVASILVWRSFFSDAGKVFAKVMGATLILWGLFWTALNVTHKYTGESILHTFPSSSWHYGWQNEGCDFDSAACELRGICGFKNGQCVATRYGCNHSSDCKEHGLCGFQNGQCIATEKDCKQSKSCDRHGLCGFQNGQCIATEKDCKQSEGCERFGLCGFQDGKCIATAEGCKQASFGCLVLDRCGYADGKCVP